MNEVVRAWHGAWRLARADPRGMTYFDDTVEAFWRSFNAAIIVAPVYAIFAAARYSTFPPLASTTRVMLVELTLYIVSWLVYPVIMLPFCRAMGRESLFLRYMVAYNWASLVQMALYAGLLFAVLLLHLPEDVADVLGEIAFVLVLIYFWNIARIGLRLGPIFAAIVVGLSYGIGEGISAITDLMVY